MPYLAPETIAFFHNLMKSSKEQGGALVQEGNVLKPPKITSSGSNSAIELGLSTYSFHTHPNDCLKKEACALGVPSSKDMRSIAVHSINGAVKHLIVAREGNKIVLYVVGLMPFLHQKLLSRDKNQVLDSIQDYFNSIQKWYSNNFYAMNYTQFRTHWLEKAREAGFEINFYSNLDMARI